MSPATISMSKHDGAGNDFLIMVDLEDRVGLSEEEVRRLTDRHQGLGADGLIVLTGPSGGAEVTMVLRNADGSPAEISGNGLRCAAHEAVRAGIVAAGEFEVRTGAGLRRVFCEPSEGRGASTWADMGEVELLELDAARGHALINVGNPHLVILRASLDGLDLEAEGSELQATRRGGINVEWIAPGPPGRLAMAVYERGVGRTLACGSGSCASAVAARALGISGDEVVVENPGGPLGIRLEGMRARLEGEVRHIADLLVPLDRDG